MKFGKKGVVWDSMIPWLIGIGVLVIILVLAFLLREELVQAGKFIKNIFRR